MTARFDFLNHKMAPVRKVGRVGPSLPAIALFCFSLMLFTAMASAANATFDSGFEDPKPEFSRQDEAVIASLIPRAKSTSISIKFTVEGARLEKVEGVDFDTVDTEEVDIKNFKSEAFRVFITDVPPGQSATLQMVSSFFSSGTRFYVYNERLSPSWRKTVDENIMVAERVYMLAVKVQDGGELDSDGQVNGQIVILGGPRDSFWGYALGTLFIRFFGIFIVLTILMIGMILSGKFFSYRERVKEAQETRATRAKPAESAPSEAEAVPGVEDKGEKDISPEMAAAVGVALKLHFSKDLQSFWADLNLPRLGSWTQQGRTQTMHGRLNSFSRQGTFKKRPAVISPYKGKK